MLESLSLLGCSSDKARSGAVNPHASTLNTLIQRGKTKRATRTSTTYEGNSSQHINQPQHLGQRPPFENHCDGAGPTRTAHCRNKGEIPAVCWPQRGSPWCSPLEHVGCWSWLTAVDLASTHSFAGHYFRVDWCCGESKLLQRQGGRGWWGAWGGRLSHDFARWGSFACSLRGHCWRPGVKFNMLVSNLLCSSSASLFFPVLVHVSFFPLQGACRQNFAFLGAGACKTLPSICNLELSVWRTSFVAAHIPCWPWKKLLARCFWVAWNEVYWHIPQLCSCGDSRTGFTFTSHT